MRHLRILAICIGLSCGYLPPPAYAVYGEVGGIDTSGGTIIYEVDWVAKQKDGSEFVVYTVVFPDGTTMTITTTLYPA